MDQVTQKEETKNEIHFDFKNIDMLADYINPHARILNRRRTHLSSRAQRELATAIKRARFMALMPYIAE